MKLKIQITHWFNGSVLFEYESDGNTMRETLEKAVGSGANLRGADLTGADLRGADLRGADLTGADLTGANLRGADLTGADLRGADLTGADLTGANLTDADLTPIKNDLFLVLLHAIKEMPYLKAAVKEGRIDGTCYEGNQTTTCSCLSGTLFNAAKVNNGPQEETRRNCILSVRDSSRPIEVFFYGIRPGHTPETSPAAKLVYEWIEEFEQLIAQ